MTSILTATQVVVHFIGLFAFYAPGADHVVHAVLPPITPALVAKGLPDHKAVILYPAGSATQAAGWTTGVHSFDPGWDYVELETGDHVSFLAPPSSNRPQIPAELAHLKNCENQDLRSGFKAPAFSDAASVVDISYGTLDAITQWARPGSMPRVDTQLAFDNNGPVVVTVTTRNMSSRVLVLPPGSCLAFAHVPASLIDVSLPSVSGVSHTLAYQAMATTPPPTVHCAASHEQAMGTMNMAARSGVVTHRRHRHARATVASSRRGKNTKRAKPSATVASIPAASAVHPSCPFPLTPGRANAMNSDCSNSQWP